MFCNEKEGWKKTRPIIIHPLYIYTIRIRFDSTTALRKKRGEPGCARNWDGVCLFSRLFVRARERGWDLSSRIVLHISFVFRASTFCIKQQRLNARLRVRKHIYMQYMRKSTIYVQIYTMSKENVRVDAWRTRFISKMLMAERV